MFDGNRDQFLPEVSIIVPVYNGAETIAACLESLLDLNYPKTAYEIIVVENGSTDATSLIASSYPVLLMHCEGRGPAYARNQAIKSSRGSILAFTDADCIVDPNWLRELVKHYADKEVGGVGGEILAYQNKSASNIQTFSKNHSPLVNYVSGEGEFLPHLYTANASYLKSTILEVGGFNERLVTGEDVDLCWRVQLKTGTKICFEPAAVVYHQHRATYKGLARQYRQYGFGEILLDTLYGGYPAYPRHMGYQLRRILNQVAALVRYTLSAIVRLINYRFGRISDYEAELPRLWFWIEFHNIQGKLEGLITTRFMRDAQPALEMGTNTLIDRFFSNADN